MKVVEEILNKYMSCIEEEASNYASQFSFLGIEFDDLYQEGMIGLLKAYHHSDNIGLSYSYVSKNSQNSCVSAKSKSIVESTSHKLIELSLSLYPIPACFALPFSIT